MNSKSLTKTCTPPTLAHTCNCPSDADARARTLPFCTPSILCTPTHHTLSPPPPPPPATEHTPRAPHHSASASTDDAASSSTDGATAYVVVLDFNPTRVRYFYRFDPFESYAVSMHLIARLVVSLRASKSRLPIHLVASGERHEGYERRLAELGVRIVGTDFGLTIPRRISNPFHIGSFSKLRALSLTQFRKIIVLDQDLVIMRSIDHLAHVPAPALVYRYKCYPELEINSGLMVLAPNASAWSSMQSLLRSPQKITRIHGDVSDQLVWRHFLRHVHALPVGYNAFRSANLVAPAGWEQAHVVHDIWRYQRRGPVDPKFGRGNTIARDIHQMGQRAKQLLAGLPTRMNNHSRGHGLPF